MKCISMLIITTALYSLNCRTFQTVGDTILWQDFTNYNNTAGSIG